MQKLFSYQFPQNIWRILPHPDGAKNEWLLELREISEKKVSFALIDLDQPDLRWHVSPEAADWWTSLTAFEGDKVLLHNYRFPEVPEPTDLICLNASDGEMTWYLPNHVMVGAMDSSTFKVVARVGDGLKYSFIEANTGQIIPFYEKSGEVHSGLAYRQPARYERHSSFFKEMASFLDLLLGCGEPLCIDYLDQKPYMVFSYYLYEQELVAQYLLVVTKNKEIFFHERVSSGREGVGHSTMILKNSTLVYLKNNNEFSSLKLS